MEKKSLTLILLVPTLLLLVPLVAMQFTREMAWTGSDFAAAWLLMAGLGLAYKLATSRGGNVRYRAAVGLALAATFVLVWGNLAVGFIGNENNPANLLYLSVIAVGVIGATFARLEAPGMARALFATALAQFAVPVVAFAIWRPEFSAGVLKVFALNTGFAALYVGSALLFRSAADTRNVAPGNTAAA